MPERTKIDQIWDLVLSLNEDDATGKIDYRKGAGGSGRISVTLDGKRTSVYIDTKK